MTNTRDDPAAGLAQRLLAGDRLALARGITLVERGDELGRELVRQVMDATGRTPTIGITGPPGVGKSTLVSALASHARVHGRKIAVLSIDPSSPFTFGALLGDRVRMSEHYLDEGVFIRSMASRGMTGGLAPAALDATLLMDAAGFDEVLIETVGVGQSEVQIASHADTIVLVLGPGAGDSVQLIKAGIMEIPDVLVVNKADHPQALQFVQELRRTVAFTKSQWKPPLVQTEATTGRGIPELVDAIGGHRAHLGDNGMLDVRRQASLRRRVLDLAAGLLWTELDARAKNDEGLQSVLDEVAARRLDPAQAAVRIVGRFRM